LIKRITSKESSYLAELIVEKKYEVHGIKRQDSSLNTSPMDHLHKNPT
jgi:GDPmannose 4,6-dehydratase